MKQTPAWVSEDLGMKCFTALLPDLGKLLLLTEDGGWYLLGLLSLVTHIRWHFATLSFHLCRVDRVVLVFPMKGELPTLFFCENCSS